MIARCARCQQTFTTEQFGTQKCPHCGAEIHLADPAAPGPPPAPPRPPAASPPAWGAPPPPPGWGGAPPPGGWGPLPPGSPPSGWGPLPPGAAPPSHDAPEQPAPFADRQRLGFLQAWIQTWKLVALEPARFFRLARIDQTGSAVLFGILGATVGLWVSSLVGSLTAAASIQMGRRVLSLVPGADPDQLNQALEQMTSSTTTLRQLILAPVAVVLWVYLGGALLHLALLVVRGAPRSFNSTLTVMGYATGLGVLNALPMCGFPVAIVWFLVALIIGLAESQRVANWKPVVAVVGPFALLACACLCAFAAGLSAFIRAASQGGATSL